MVLNETLSSSLVSILRLEEKEEKDKENSRKKKEKN